jgi:hypothetical protein
LLHTLHACFRAFSCRHPVDRLAVRRAERWPLHHRRGQSSLISHCVSCICLNGEADNRTPAGQTARRDILHPDAAAYYRVAALNGSRPLHGQQLQCDQQETCPAAVTPTLCVGRDVPVCPVIVHVS